MKRVIKDGAPPVLVDLMQRQSSGMTTIAVARTTIDKDRGEDSPSTAEAFIGRQFGAQQKFHGERSDMRRLELRGVSVVGKSGLGHPLEALFLNYGPRVIGTAISVDRVSRHVGALEKLRDLAVQKEGDLVIQLHTRERVRRLRFLWA